MSRAPAPANDRAVVLRRFAYGESSLVVHLLSARHGRVHLVAKGAFRPTSAYFAALDLFDTLELGWRPSRGEGLGTLVRARVVTSRRHLARDLDRYRAAEAVLALAGLGMREGAADPGLFALAERTLDALRAAGADAALERVAFELRFLEELGLGIALATCARCGEPPGAPTRAGAPFSVAAGGRLCAPCGAQARATGERVGFVLPDVLRIAERLVREPRTAGLRLTPPQRAGLDRLAARFLAWHVEAGSRTGRALADRVAAGDPAR